MNKTLFFLLTAVILSLAFYDKKQSVHPVQVNFVHTMSQLNTEMNSLQTQLKDLTKEELIQQYFVVRKLFKEAEYLIAYVDAELYETRINESPLLKPLKGVAQKEIHAPGGFQVLDESLFSDTINKEEISEIILKLGRELSFFQKRLQSIKLSEAQMLVALKLEMIRSFTMGITGFDTPGSMHAITDLKSVNTSLITAFNQINIRYQSEHLKELVAHLENTEYSSFDEFNRFAYYKEVLLPAFGKMEAFRIENNIESEEEMHMNPLAYNSKFTNIFSPQFLNKSYFLHVAPSALEQDKIDLGKQLFNDKLLSQNGDLSCASCHNKDKAFTDQVAKSLNFMKDTLKRNSPSLNYSIYATQYFHDMRAQELKNQMEHVFTSPLEFNSTPLEITEKLVNHPTYPSLFKQCFPEEDHPVSITTLYTVIKSYLASLPTFDSEFDRAISDPEVTISQDVINGFNLFMGKAQCATCHFPPTFSGLVPPYFKDSESEVLGVLKDENFENPVLDEDAGRAANGILKEGYEFYANSFKTPTIRNVSISFPYMHNGSITSLEKVVDFYNEGGGAGLGLDIPHQTLPTDKLNLTQKEKADLVKFMEALTDSVYVQ
ncbi:cytochrome c peroxidase [Lishizhenia tianjinensis]|uniref:Cytochrome c peroxidase n=1 Tax=Lishizhenia tianjinensis TaxID=477690 RepID=A0A1I7A000_9FLAO|nr:cytochrome c peroxidase [Lishizhenia tianjinensis]SFT68266.1 cytochrome c peroxidase [Lishizhenia tianjinensis]